MADESPSQVPRPNHKDEADDHGPRLPRHLAAIILLVVFAIMMASVIKETFSKNKDFSYHEFRQTWNAEKKAYVGYSEALLQNDVLELTLLPEGTTEPPKPDSKESDKNVVRKRVKIPHNAVDSQLLAELATIPKFKYEPPNEFLFVFMNWIFFPILLMAMLYFLLMRLMRTQGPGNVLAFGRSRPKLVAKDNAAVRFDDVAGVDEAKEEVKEVIEFLKMPEKFEKLGGRIPHGLLFVGPPGTGKTLLAKAIAGEADVPFFSICGSDFVEMFVGVGASRVRDLFRQAKENRPCIIFLDEIDAVGRRRGSGLGGGHDEREQTLNAILVEMDGFDTNDQVIVIAATNRPDVLDPALLRPGRFDREVVINLPELQGRFEILKVHSRHIKLADKVDLMRIARGTPMFSGADLEALINEAAIRATMAGKNFVEEDDLEEARDKVRFGRQKRSRAQDAQEQRLTAYHEAGHAMVMLRMPHAEPLHKVTIIPRGMSGGMTMWLPDKDRYHYTVKQLLAQITVTFGGRLAEELFLGDISTGASMDISQATDMARRMVCEFGMSDAIGPIRYTTKEQHVFLGGEISQPREFSEATAERIDQAVHKIIDECLQQARQIIEDNREPTELLAQALIKHETLSKAEIDKILEAKSVDAVALKNGHHQPQPTDAPLAAAAP